VQGPFFLNYHGQLYATDGPGGTVVNTGGWGISLSAGKDASGNDMAVIRDFNSQVYIYDQGSWIATGGWAREVIAGVNGEFFARDFNNTVYRYQLGVGWSIATSPGTNSAAPHTAVQMSLGQQIITDPLTQTPTIVNVLYTRNPNNHIEVFREDGSFVPGAGWLATYSDTGGFGQDIAAGYQGEVFVRDMNSQLYLFNGTSWNATGAWAYSLDVGQTDGSDYLAFKDFNSRVYVFETANGRFIDTGGYAQQVSAGANAVYLRDFNNDVHYYDLTFGGWIDTGHYALQIAAVGVDQSFNALALDALWGIDADPNQAGHVFVLDEGNWIPLPGDVAVLGVYRGN
jgi:hypothetical protein